MDVKILYWNSPCENALMVPGLGAVVSLHNLLPEGAVLELDFVRMDGLQTLVQNLQHAHQLGANLGGKRTEQ